MRLKDSVYLWDLVKDQFDTNNSGWVLLERWKQTNKLNKYLFDMYIETMSEVLPAEEAAKWWPFLRNMCGKTLELPEPRCCLSRCRSFCFLPITNSLHNFTSFQQYFPCGVLVLLSVAMNPLFENNENIPLNNTHAPFKD